MISDRRFLLAMLAVAIATVAVMPLLWGGEDPILKQRRQQIETMSPSEREHLDRNFQRFTELSEAERGHFQELHAALEADRKSRRGGLNDALHTYEQWLQTLPLYERDALQKEQDPAERIARIREVLVRQQEDRLEFRLGAQREGRLGPIPTLSPDDLQRVLDVLHHTAEAILPAVAVTRQLEGYEGIARTLKLFEMLGRQDQRLIALLTEGRMRRLMEAISDEQARQQLETIPGKPQSPLPARRVKMVLMLWTNLELAVERETKKRKVTDSMMSAALAELPDAEQEELFELSPRLFRLELRARSVDAEAARPIDRRMLRKFFRPNVDNRTARSNAAASTSGSRSGRERPRRRTAEPNDAN